MNLENASVGADIESLAKLNPKEVEYREWNCGESWGETAVKVEFEVIK